VCGRVMQCWMGSPRRRCGRRAPIGERVDAQEASDPDAAAREPSHRLCQRRHTVASIIGRRHRAAVRRVASSIAA
jgi:hypothetical protein